MTALTKNKQLIYLFLCNFSILFTGFGLFPLLPLYAAEFGANAALIGFYLAVTYIAISIGSILAGQLSERLSRKTLFLAAGLVGMPALVLPESEPASLSDVVEWVHANAEFNRAFRGKFDWKAYAPFPGVTPR